MIQFKKLKRVVVAIVLLSVISSQSTLSLAYAEEQANNDETSMLDGSISMLDDEDSNPSKSFVYLSETGASYAGSTWFKYCYGVNGEVGYINVTTSDTSDITISGYAIDSWGEEHYMYTSASQTTYASTFAKCPTFNQISIVEYNIRVDGLESGTNVSGSKQFAAMSY